MITFEGKYDPEVACEIIEAEARRNYITVHKCFKAAVGRAHHKKRYIKIPVSFKDPQAFLVALHEIGHIMMGKIKRVIDNEFAAIYYGISKGYEFGVPDEIMKQWIARESAYLLTKIAKGRNRIKKLPKLKQEIRDFLKYDFEHWNEADAVYIYLKDYKKPERYIIKFKHSDPEIDGDWDIEVNPEFTS